MRKPRACQGCPAYEFSTDWVPDEIKPGATVYLLNQNPGEEEEVLGEPMVGKTGQLWEGHFLKDAGLSRDQINVGNVIRCRWHRSNDLPPVASVLVKAAIQHCQAAHFRVPPETKLLVAAGDYACLALTGSTVADGDKAGNGWRGYLKPLGSSVAPSYWLPRPGQPLPVLVTWHIARTFHEPKWILPTLRDWRKVSRVLAGTWPIAPPVIVAQPPQPWPEMFTFDTEFRYNRIHVKRALSSVRSDVQYLRDMLSEVLRALESREACEVSSRATSAQWDHVLALLRGASSRAGIEVRSEETWEDVGRLLSGLGVSEESVRYMRREAKGKTRSGDSSASRSLPRDNDLSGASVSAVQYWLRTLSGLSENTEAGDQVPELIRYSMCWGPNDGETCVVEAGQHITPSNFPRSRVVTQYSPADVQHLSALIFGEDIPPDNEFIWRAFLIEDSVWKHAVLWSDHQHDLNYLGSVYSPFNRWKHLGESNPTLYAGLDATGLYYVDRALAKELDGDPASRRVWEDIDRPALGEFVRAQYRGIRTDPVRIAQAIQQLQTEVDQASYQAQALVGWPINLGSNQMVAHQLYKQEGLKAPR